MQAKTRRGGPVEVEGLPGFAHIGAQFFPGVALRDDAFSQRLGDEAAVGFLGHLKNEFVHAKRASAFSARRQAAATTLVLISIVAIPLWAGGGSPRRAVVPVGDRARSC